MSLLEKQAPDFSLYDHSGHLHSNDDYNGSYVLLYFYPKDMTPGCTVEAQGFRDTLHEFEKLGVQVLGVSGDDDKCHAKFIEKYNLNFPLLSDTERKVCLRYKVCKEKSMFGKKYIGIARESFLINPDGKVIKHYTKVSPATHPQEVLKDIREVQGK